MKALLVSARAWRSLIPTQLHSLRRTADNIKDPLFRYFEREVTLGVKLLAVVRSDLDQAIAVCEGKRKQTNYHRSLLAELNKGMLPSQWNKYKVPSGWTVIQWVTDFSQRIEQLDKVTAANASGVKALKSMPVWLGGLFVPEAYITATRQYVAQAHSISLEELCLSVNVTSGNGTPAIDNRTFAVSGLILQGAVCNDNRLSLCTDISTKLPLALLSWNSIESQKKSPDNKVTLPIYRNGMRTQLLFTLAFDVPGDETAFHERGVAILSAD
jgi:dynein heavy chain 1